MLIRKVCVILIYLFPLFAQEVENSSINYGNEEYEIIQIENRFWLSKNLDFGTLLRDGEKSADNKKAEKLCIDNNELNCEKYGGLYSWNEAMQYSTRDASQGICPQGWHIPTMLEFESLSKFGSGEIEINGFLHSLFKQFGGELTDKNKFVNEGQSSLLWTSTKIENNYPLSVCYKVNQEPMTISKELCNKEMGASVRCVKDEKSSNFSLEEIKLVFPQNDKEHSTSLAFEWDWIGKNIKYCLIISEDSSFYKPVFSQCGIKKNHYQIYNLRPSTQYFWKIKAINESGSSLYSKKGKFQTERGDTELYDKLFGSKFKPSYTERFEYTQELVEGLINDYYENHLESILIGDNENKVFESILISDNKYKVVEIGTQKWLNANLNTGELINSNLLSSNNDIIEKYCYDNVEENCDKYGGLYSWSEALNYLDSVDICPEGWHIPNKMEFDTLINNLNSVSSVHKTSEKLIFNDTYLELFVDEYSGYLYTNGMFNSLDQISYWWTSENKNEMQSYFVSYNKKTGKFSGNNFDKSAGFGIRCIKDE